MTPTRNNAWQSRANALAEWTEKWLVVRRDRHGAYQSDGRPWTAEEFDRKRIVQHFRATSACDVMGLHSTAIVDNKSVCKWVGVDIDAHDSDGTADPEANWRLARRILEMGKGLGFQVLLTDSNSKGGYHVRLIFDQEIS